MVSFQTSKTLDKAKSQLFSMQLMDLLVLLVLCSELACLVVSGLRLLNFSQIWVSGYCHAGLLLSGLVVACLLVVAGVLVVCW